MLIAGVELSLIALLTQDIPNQIIPVHWLGLFLLATILTAGPFALWFSTIKQLGAVTVAPFMLLVPVTAFILDALIKGVWPTSLQLVAAALAQAQRQSRS